MSEVLELSSSPAGDELSVALGELSAVVDRLLGVDLSGVAAGVLEGGLRELVVQSRRLPAVRNALVADAIGRGVPSSRSAASPAGWLRQLLRLHPGEATAWVRDTEDLVGYRSLTGGELLPATCPAVAAAVEAGAISTEHARLITRTLRRAPTSVPRDGLVRAEVRLVRYALTQDPKALGLRCQEVLDELDPDGSLGKDREEQERSRSFHVGAQDKHGMYPVRGHLTPEVGAMLNAALSPLCAPRPGPDGQPDPATPEQRSHDALGDLARRALAAGDLPVRHGVPATMMVTISLDQLQARTGVVSTAHGGRITVRDLLRLAAEMAVIPVVLDSDGQVLHFGEEQRLATPAQRHALYVLDVGCTFQGCSIPGVWCQAAHGEPFRTSHHTTIDDLALLCGYHHRLMDGQEWTIERIRGRIWLTPPRWIDPDQLPRTNEHFHPLRE